MAISSEVNPMSFKNIGENSRGSDAIIFALIAKLRCLFACVALVQLCTPEYNAYNLYVVTCARKTGVVGGVPSYFGRRGVMRFVCQSN